MIQVKQIRQSFLDFFKKEGHDIVSSSPLVPRNDPTLLFTNAGMVQFKDYFTGVAQPTSARAVSTQKCVRAGGKHNDLENVGYTARHHTFFEMLGNFSFGDYFKEDAIDFAWRLLTKEWGLSPDKLLITVYDQDEDAARLWKKVAGLSDSKIIRISTTDNFWSMGDTGPCGPCSEIFYDHGEDVWGGPPGSETENGDRFIEIWNLVFMQFEQLATGERVGLPKPSIDTGMGLERVAAVLQGRHNNYEIDLFQRIIQASCAFTGKDHPEFIASHRVIADHLRSASFLMADGVMPSNEGRGYVLRRIMRRAMRHVHLLGYKDLLLHKLFPVLLQEMGEPYPELVRAQSLITETFKLEESRFKETLDRGLVLLDNESKTLSSGAVLSGDVAFKLYDTFGFPLDLTQDVLKSKNISVDLPSFESAMEKQRRDARKSWVGSGENQTEEFWYALKESFGNTEFLGYDTQTAEGLLQALIVDGKSVQTVNVGQKVFLLANQTPFYAESGGQMGDSGLITTPTGSLRVLDCLKKLGGLSIHYAECVSGHVSTLQAAKFEVDHTQRSALRANHSATHLLHAVLREVLGDHVTQKGSLVAPDRLRFDFSHSIPLTFEQLQDVEDRVNALILANGPSSTRVMNSQDAIQAGAMALFGEKYGDEVRVVSMGHTAALPYSVELCGGTHVHATGEIGLFKILAETSVASGVRRIEAITALNVLEYVRENDRILSELSHQFKISRRDLVNKTQSLLEDTKRLEREINDLKLKLAHSSASNALRRKEIKGVTFFAQTVEGLPIPQIRALLDEMKAKHGSGIYAIGGIEGEKVSLLLSISSDLKVQFDAVHLIKGCVDAIGGKGGGGRPDLAQAGGSNPAGLSQAFSILETMIQES